MNKSLIVVSVIFLAVMIGYSQASDAALQIVTEKDKTSRTAGRGLADLTPSEHLARGKVYFENRQFPQAREHLQFVLDDKSLNPSLAQALFMIGRSYMWERQYDKAIGYFERVAREYPGSKDGREGLSFDAACQVRIGHNSEAAKIYEQYTVMYPTGERVESAYLNEIDALRESHQFEAAESWVSKASIRFAGTSTETNALQARLRLEIYRGRWNDAISVADSLLSNNRFYGSMTSADEVKFLKGLALENMGKRDQATEIYLALAADGNSYFAGLASDKAVKSSLVKTISQVAPRDFPLAFPTIVVQEAHKWNLDPRFVLAIMKQESTFRPGIKSPSAARGLLQLVFDTALKYKDKAGYSSLNPDDLYDPKINIAVGCTYIAALRDEFGGLNEAIAASYNGGEDNAARWLSRSNPRVPAVFTAEVGFAETKSYVFKVMNNYRVYKQLYDENLIRRN